MPGLAMSAANEPSAARARRQRAGAAASRFPRLYTMTPAATSRAATRHERPPGRSARSPQAEDHPTARPRSARNLPRWHRFSAPTGLVPGEIQLPAPVRPRRRVPNAAPRALASLRRWPWQSTGSAGRGGASPAPPSMPAQRARRRPGSTARSGPCPPPEHRRSAQSQLLARDSSLPCAKKSDARH